MPLKASPRILKLLVFPALRGRGRKYPNLHHEKGDFRHEETHHASACGRLICSAFSAANAADIKAKGMWDFSFEYTNDSFDKHNSSDRFGAAQRLRTQIDVIASESLKGVVYFEIGDTHWGHAKDGASLGTDGRTR